MISPYLKIAAKNNKELQSFRPLPKETLKSLREFYRVGLTYTSNALEGNSLTETETKVVIENGLTINGRPLHDIYEAVGHAKAYDHIHELVKNKTIEEQDALTLHRLFYQQIDPERAGIYRQVPVVISGSRYPVTPPAKVPQEMKKFIEWFNKNESKMNPVEFAAQVHKKFVFIHPFVDGNGRVARLLMNLALLRGDYTITLIPAIRRMEYVSALEAAHIDDKGFINFIADCVVATQTDLIRLLRNSIAISKQNSNQASDSKNTSEDILAAIKANSGINAPTLASTLNVSLRTIQRHQKELSDADKIEFRGAKKNGGYWNC